MSDSTDIEIVRKVVAGDTEAFAEIVRRYQDRVFRFVYGHVDSYDEAYDAAQDVFVQVMESLASFRGESKFSTWLYSVTSNYCKNYRRKKSRMKSVSISRGSGEDEYDIPLPDTRECTEDKVILDEMVTAVHQEMGRLPSDYRDILRLRDVEGLPYEEISAVMGITLSNVKVRIHRGREMLRKRMAERGFI
jgi:RNA polymerase sigma-70 factor (ECF subfamily)